MVDFWKPERCVVVGASGGLGRAFVDALAADSAVLSVHALSRSGATGAENVPKDVKVKTGRLDLEDSASIERAAEVISRDGEIDLVVVATGLLHDEAGYAPEKSLKEITPEGMARSFAINTIGPALVAQSFLPLMAKGRKTVFAALSARVGSISDNRLGGWYSYRAAKAALNQMLRTAAIEQNRRWPECVVVGLHPGTVDTGLSKPFQKNVRDGALFQPDYAVTRMLDVIGKLESIDSGGAFAYDGSQIPS